MTLSAGVFVHLLPRLIPAGALRGGVAVVLDVLRATSVMVHALAAGCTAIFPCDEVEDALSVAKDFSPERVLLSGERQGVPIPGFDLGNSLADYTPERCGGKTIVMTTTNGTRAILASLDAERVFAASFANARVTLELLRAEQKRGRAIHVVCAGTDGMVSLEDTLLAGMIASELTSVGEHATNDALLIARAAWRSLGDPDVVRLRDFLTLGRGGRRVIELGYAADIADAAGAHESYIVAELARDPVRIVARR